MARLSKTAGPFEMRDTLAILLRERPSSTLPQLHLETGWSHAELRDLLGELSDMGEKP